jgi:hypothetical protein
MHGCLAFRPGTDQLALSESHLVLGYKCLAVVLAMSERLHCPQGPQNKMYAGAVDYEDIHQRCELNEGVIVHASM